MKKEICEFAKQYSEYFYLNGFKGEVHLYGYTSDTPDWFKELVNKLHGNKERDDYTTHFIVKSFGFIAKDEEAKPSGIFNTSKQLYSWLSSNSSRIKYVETEINDHYVNNLYRRDPELNLLNCIERGFFKEFTEFYNTVKASINHYVLKLYSAECEHSKMENIGI
jgi:hypothetical protein